MILSLSKSDAVCMQIAPDTHVLLEFWDANKVLIAHRSCSTQPKPRIGKGGGYLPHKVHADVIW